MKKTFSLILSIILMANLFMSVYAEKEKSGDYSYSILSDGTIEITEYAYPGYNSTLNIPNTLDDKKVTRIGLLVFYMHDELINVTIPNGIIKIDNGAFQNCKNLNEITIPSSMITIGEAAFAECESLKSVTIPNSVTKIDSYAFGYYFDDDRQPHKYNDFKIYGYTGSEAQRYAVDNGFAFISLGKAKNPVKVAKTAISTKTIKPIISKPKKATIKKLTPKKKALKVIWKKVSGAKGYEIKLATNKKFTKNKKTVKVKKGSATSKTIKKLKSGKKYYVKIRAYKKVTIDGYTVTANGAWSKVKSKKIK